MKNFFLGILISLTFFNNNLVNAMGITIENIGLRDLFASSALCGYLSGNRHYESQEELTRWCWGVADAMIAAKGNRK